MSKPTWVCLDGYYEFKDSELVQRHFSGHVNRIGELPEKITIELMECAVQTDDISGQQAAIIRLVTKTWYVANPVPHLRIGRRPSALNRATGAMNMRI